MDREPFERISTRSRSPFLPTLLTITNVCVRSPTIRLLVRRAEPAEALLELRVWVHETVGRVRSFVVKLLVDSGQPSDSDAQLHLVWGGVVLSDDDAIVSKMGIPDGASLWVLRDEKALGALRAELSAWRGARFLWRGLSAEEEAMHLSGRLIKEGLNARCPAAGLTLEDSITAESSQGSQFIFSSLDADTAAYYAAACNSRPDCHVVQLDMAKIDSKTLFDVSEVDKCAKLEVDCERALSFATAHRMVAIRDRVPPEAIVSIHDVTLLNVPRGLPSIALRSYREMLSGSARAAIQEWHVQGIREFLASGGDISVQEMADEIECSRMYNWSILSSMCDAPFRLSPAPLHPLPLTPSPPPNLNAPLLRPNLARTLPAPRSADGPHPPGSFPLRSCEPSDEQRCHVDDYAALLDSFLQSVSAGSAVWTWQPPEDDRNALASVVAALTSVEPAPGRPYVWWFAGYGCALLATVPFPSKVCLELICLDEWTFEMHSGPTGRTHTAHVGRDSASHLPDRHINARAFESFCELVTILLSRAQTRHGRKRSAASNEQGHQKTPAMIKAVMKDAFDRLDTYMADLSTEIEEGCTPARGGFTDVGLHSGGHRRNTTWPLVRAVTQTLLEADSHSTLYRRSMAELQLWMTERTTALLAPQYQINMQRSAFKSSADSAMQMLVQASSEGAELADEELPMASFEARCVLVRFQLERAVEVLSSNAAQSRVLPLLSRQDVHSRKPELRLPEVTMPAFDADNLDAARMRALSNLGCLPMSPPADVALPIERTGLSSWCALSAWLDDARLQPAQIKQENHTTAALLVLRSVEEFVLSSFSAALIEPAASIVTCELAGEVCTQINSCLDKYRLVADAFREMPSSRALMAAELDSRELLIVWVSFCLVHKMNNQCEPLLANFGVPIEPKEIRHLKLSDKVFSDAALQVVAYLHSARDDRPSLFSLREDDQTMSFALQRARGDSVVMAAWRTEQAAAKGRQQHHWTQVLSKQERLRELDENLAELKGQMISAERAFDNTAYPSPHTSSQNDSKRSEASKKIKRLTGEITETNELITATEKPPYPVLQPLPMKEDLALPILFFILIPPHLQVCSSHVVGRCFKCVIASQHQSCSTRCVDPLST